MPDSPPVLDAPGFRAAMSRLATGVSVVTTVDRDGRDFGMTVTSMCSLSLEPPLILVCVGHAATMYPQMTTASHFAVNILGAEQQSLSRRFAERIENKFDGVVHTHGITGCALLVGAAVQLECSVWAKYEGGDHTIFIGLVHHAIAGDASPLVYHRGGYARLGA